MRWGISLEAKRRFGRLLVGAIAGAAAAAPSPALAAGGPGCNPHWPVVAHYAGGNVIAPPAGFALPVACANETGYASSESTVAVTNTGVLVYSPAHTENSMARSLDGGATWSLTYPANEQATAFWNTVDPFVIADRRTGRLFWSHATGPVRNEGGLPQGSGFYLAAAYGFQLYASADQGRTWTTADYSAAPTGDWEKVMVGPPPPASTGAQQPSGYPGVVYLCANSPVEVSGPGRLCYKSLDGGATFVIAGYNSPSIGQPQDVCPPLNFNNGVVDSTGTIYIPATCVGSDYVSISHDEGSTYSWVAQKDAPTGSSVSGGFLQLAVDDSDNLYALWPAKGLLYMEVSRDHAKTWSAPMMVAAPGVTNVQRPAFAAGAAGHIGITYYASKDPAADRISAYITQTENGLETRPLFYSGVLNYPAHPIFHDEGLTGGSPRLDFIGGAYDSPGTTFWAGVVKQFGPSDSNRQIATTGYVGRLAFNAVTAATADAGGHSFALVVPAGCVSRKRGLRLRVNATSLQRRRAKIERVSFYVDGKLRATRRKAPFTASIDVRKLAAGTHAARVKIVLARTRKVRGRRVTTRTTVTLKSRFRVC
jgi:hypothetical protein